MSGYCQVYGEIRKKYGYLDDDDTLVNFFNEVLALREKLDEIDNITLHHSLNWYSSYIYMRLQFDDAMANANDNVGDNNGSENQGKDNGSDNRGINNGNGSIGEHNGNGNGKSSAAKSAA